ncbi:hypothetical protein [Kistimonas asteriae]|uniref:hypothetical protein n=1 Tax=Kistimonas asteriae TaxID=517724 RepID=UPI001BA8518C|nr:hypothetical protein [Kistimonas asteriae]
MTDSNERELQAFDEALTPLYKEAMIDPPDHLDNAIKAKARRAVSAGPSRVTLDSTQTKAGFFRRRELWQVPLSLAAGLMLGVLIMPGTRQTDTSDISSSEMVFMGDQHTASEEVSSLENLPPEEWVRTIASLLLQGDTKKAEALLIVFNRQFPEFTTQDKTH